MERHVNVMVERGGRPVTPRIRAPVRRENPSPDALTVKENPS
jgi:hypothetical protein